MKHNTAYLVGAGAFTTRGFHPGRGDFIIAADGGADTLKLHGIKPHLLLGDMDSVRQHPKGVARLRFPKQKDDTDLALAVRLAAARGYRRVKLYGALGGRMDHSLANLQLLADCAQQGVRAALVDPSLTALSVHNGRLCLPPIRKGATVSIFSWANLSQGVSLKGLFYPLRHATLTNTLPLGISNQGMGKPVSILAEEGTLIVMIMQGQY